MIVYLVDADGNGTKWHGVFPAPPGKEEAALARAQAAARALLDAGNAAEAIIRAMTLVYGVVCLEARYKPAGREWRLTMTEAGVRQDSIAA